MYIHISGLGLFSLERLIADIFWCNYPALDTVWCKCPLVCTGEKGSGCRGRLREIGAASSLFR